MATQIKDLPTIINADVDDLDLIIVDDRSEDITKVMTFTELGKRFLGQEAVDGKADVAYVDATFKTIVDADADHELKADKLRNVINPVGLYTALAADVNKVVANTDPSTLVVNLPAGLDTGYNFTVYAQTGDIVLNAIAPLIGLARVEVGGFLNLAYDGTKWLAFGNAFSPEGAGSYIADSPMSKGDVVIMLPNGNVETFVPTSVGDTDERSPILGLVTEDHLALEEVSPVVSEKVLRNVLVGATAGDTVNWTPTGLSTAKPANNVEWVEVGTAINATDMHVWLQHRGRA